MIDFKNISSSCSLTANTLLNIVKGIPGVLYGKEGSGGIAFVVSGSERNVSLVSDKDGEGWIIFDGKNEDDFFIIPLKYFGFEKEDYFKKQILSFLSLDLDDAAEPLLKEDEIVFHMENLQYRKEIRRYHVFYKRKDVSGELENGVKIFGSTTDCSHFTDSKHEGSCLSVENYFLCGFKKDLKEQGFRIGDTINLKDVFCIRTQTTGSGGFLVDHFKSASFITEP